MNNDNLSFNIGNSPLKRPNYVRLKVARDEIKNTIYHHPEFAAFGKQMEQVFEQWKTQTIAHTNALDKGLRPKDEIHAISENLLKHYDNQPLIDKYAMYQHLMDYWNETMQDDFYEIAADGWIAGCEVKRLEKKNKKGNKETGIEGIEGRLIPPALIIQEYFSNEQLIIDNLQLSIENLNAQMEELRGEHGGEDGLLANAIDDKGKISKASLAKAIKDLGKRNEDNAEEWDMLTAYKKLMDQEADIQTQIKTAKAELEKNVFAQYPKLSIEEIKKLVIEKKWMSEIEKRIRSEMEGISHRLTQRIKELAERYETPLPAIQKEVEELQQKVEEHLKQMGYKWSALGLVGLEDDKMTENGHSNTTNHLNPTILKS